MLLDRYSVVLDEQFSVGDRVTMHYEDGPQHGTVIRVDDDKPSMFPITVRFDGGREACIADFGIGNGLLTKEQP